MSAQSDLQTFDGLDNRRALIEMLNKLGTDLHRARFVASLLPETKFVKCNPFVSGPCDTVTAYFMLVSISNELGMSINDVAQRLEKEVRGK